MRTRLARLGALAASVTAVLATGGPALAADTNVALNTQPTAMVGLLPALSCSLGSGPGNAVDGAASNIYTDKWCVPSGKPTLTITLPPTRFGYNVSQIVIKHAGVAESSALNTRAYTLDATQLRNVIQFTSPYVCTRVTLPVASTLATVTANTANTTTHAFTSLRNVTSVSLTVDVPTQGTNPATRIYEVEVWGVPSLVLSNGPSPSCLS